MDLVFESARLERALSRPPLIRANGKRALDEGWPIGPFDDPDGWRSRLTRHRGNVGLVMGRGMLAVDVDAYKPGSEGAWDALVDRCELDTDTVRQLSGGGGLHALYGYDPALHVPSVALGPRGYPGIEIKADGGYIVCAPSIHPESGRPYCWEAPGWAPGEIVVVRATPALLGLVGAGDATNGTRGHWRELTDDDLAKLDPRDLECLRILCEDFGGHDPVMLAGGTIGVYRPGKERESASATIGYIGPGVAKVWSDGWPPFRQGQVVDVGQLHTLAGRVPKIEVPTLELPAGYRLWTPGDDVVPDPVLSSDALHGPVGEYLEVLDGRTEAHPAAVGIQTLASFGTIIGRRARYRAGRAVHHCNLFVAVIGPTSEGGKGVADEEAAHLIEAVEPAFYKAHPVGGLGSGEALLDELADDSRKEKRRIVVDCELSAVLKVVRREGGILGDVLRKAFDYAPLRHSTVNAGTGIATRHHVAVLGSITPSELRALVDDLAIANGFANRFLLVWSRIATLLPFGDDVDNELVEKIGSRIAGTLQELEAKFAINGSVHFALDDDARSVWSDFYYGHRLGVGDGIMRALTGRQVVHAARLALIYAVLDGATMIRAEHVRAAIAWCDYGVATAEKTFGDGPGGKAGMLLAAVRDAMPDGLDGAGVNQHVSKNWNAGELEDARHTLEQRNLIVVFKQPTGGRPRDRYFALTPLRKKGKRGER